MPTEYTPSEKRALLEAAESGDLWAQSQLGAIYATGGFGSTDLQESVKWYSKAAASGSTDAQYNLALMLLKGEGLQKDIMAGLALLTKAASSADADAKYAEELLGSIYELGAFGMEKDITRAFEWYNKAAAHGNPKAQYALGLLYLSGDGVPQDEGKAIELITLAAQNGFQDAVAYIRHLPRKS